MSLSARRAWIEIRPAPNWQVLRQVALRKESVDRNGTVNPIVYFAGVALRKESVERNA